MEFQRINTILIIMAIYLLQILIGRVLYKNLFVYENIFSYRSKRAIKSRQAYRFANKTFGKFLIIWGTILLVLNIIASILMYKFYEDIMLELGMEFITLIIVMILMVNVIAIYFRTESKLKKMEK